MRQSIPGEPPTAVCLAAIQREKAEVFKLLPRLRRFRQWEVLHPLVLFLGSAQGGGDKAREVLWELAKDRTVREQALICIAWRKDTRDLPELGKVIVDDDPAARSIPCHLRNGYGTAALPYLLSGRHAGSCRRLRGAYLGQYGH